MDHGIYIHVPFCRSKCGYCSFYSISDLYLIDKYVDRIILDITKTLSGSEKINADTIYFGGGTPSLLSPSSIESIIQCLHDNAGISENAEFTIEMNPEDAVDSKISGYINAGVNRIVLGVQTLNQEFHDTAGRSGNLCIDDVLDRFFSITGFIHCVDLITGIPGHTPENIKPEIERILKYQPEHISAYILSVEKGTPVYNKIKRDEVFDKMQVDVFRSVINILKDAGYDHYEISNFSLNGNISRHNMKYWKYDPYIGFGPSSHSFCFNQRYCNNMNVDEYINSDTVQNIADMRDAGSVIAEIFLTGLRLLQGVSIEEIAEKAGVRIPETVLDRLKTLAAEGKINMDSKGLIKIDNDYFFFADSVIFDIVQDII
jgi:oxygen-independent coproporphyrinogen-3 oxidase